jgi:uncharacterized protein YndB with AHSA1/START domain
MSIWHKVFTTQIEGSPEVIFELIADMPNYGRWLSGSKAFGATTQVSPYPVRLGTTYLDAGPAGQRPGSVTEYAPPKHIGFHHSMVLKLGPITGNADIDIRYTLEPEGRSTRVVRVLDMTLQVPALLRPLVIRAFRKENERLLAELKRYVEALPKQG